MSAAGLATSRRRRNQYIATPAIESLRTDISVSASEYGRT